MDQPLIPFCIAHCGIFVHCNHIESLIVTDYSISHIIGDYVFDSCFNLLLSLLIILAVLGMTPKSCLL